MVPTNTKCIYVCVCVMQHVTHTRGVSHASHNALYPTPRDMTRNSEFITVRRVPASSLQSCLDAMNVAGFKVDARLYAMAVGYTLAKKHAEEGVGSCPQRAGWRYAAVVAASVVVGVCVGRCLGGRGGGGGGNFGRRSIR